MAPLQQKHTFQIITSQTPICPLPKLRRTGACFPLLFAGEFDLIFTYPRFPILHNAAIMVPVQALYSFSCFFSSQFPLFTEIYGNFRKFLSKIICVAHCFREAVWNIHQETSSLPVRYGKKYLFYRIVIDYFHNA